jgi:hypothetical protein
MAMAFRALAFTDLFVHVLHHKQGADCITAGSGNYDQG